MESASKTPSQTTKTSSISAEIAEYVEKLPPHSYVTAADFQHLRDPVNTALSRLCAAEKLRRVRRGLYWKGTETWLGMSHPSNEGLAIKVGGPGSGPADISASNMLSLTTQVPAKFWVAVPTRVPKPLKWVQFTERPAGRRLRELRPVEVAVIEVMRVGLWAIEVNWSDVETVVSDLVEQGKLRTRLVDEQIREEHHVLARERWGDLVKAKPVVREALAA